MNKAKIFPVLLITLQLGAAVVYGFSKNSGKTLYWFVAAVLNCIVEFML